MPASDVRSNILIAIVCGLLIGVFARSSISLGVSVAAFTALLSGALAVLALPRRSHTLMLASVFLFSLGIGIIRMHSAFIPPSEELSGRLGETVMLEGVVFQEPDVRESSTRISLRADILYRSPRIEDSESIGVHAGVLVIAPAHAEIAYGDRIRASGTLHKPESFDTGSGRAFDYPGYLAKDGILYELAFAQVEIAGEGERNVFKSAAISAKLKYLAGIRNVLPEPHAGLAGGITVGDKRSIGEQLSEKFRTTGLSHIIVLSGYNISIVMDAAARGIRFLPFSAQLASNLIIVAFFILMTGGASSAIRAGAMALIAVYARRSGRVYLPLRILGVVAAAMVVWNPYILVFDPGFQLSVIATAGLILFTPLFSERFGWIPSRWGFREIAAATVSAQIAVLPLLLYQNGQLPIFSLPANILALIAIPPAMAFSALAALAGMLLGIWGVPFSIPAYALLSYIIGVAEFLASLPFSSVSVLAFSAWWLLGAYILLVAGFMRIKRREAGKEPGLL